MATLSTIYVCTASLVNTIYTKLIEFCPNTCVQHTCTQRHAHTHKDTKTRSRVEPTEGQMAWFLSFVDETIKRSVCVHTR